MATRDEMVECVKALSAEGEAICRKIAEAKEKLKVLEARHVEIYGDVWSRKIGLIKAAKRELADHDQKVELVRKLVTLPTVQIKYIGDMYTRWIERLTDKSIMMLDETGRTERYSRDTGMCGSYKRVDVNAALAAWEKHNAKR